jgi:hypothetical protein
MRSFILAMLVCTMSAAATPGWLGVYYDPVAPIPALESELDRDELLGAASGLRLSLVFPDSPAELAGLMPGDLIFALNAEPFTSPSGEIRQDFRARMEGRLAGERVRFHLIRDAIDREFSGPDGDFWIDPETYLDALPHGERIEVKAFKEQRILEVIVTLGSRPEAKWPTPPTNEEIYPEDLYSTFVIASNETMQFIGGGDEAKFQRRMEERGTYLDDFVAGLAKRENIETETEDLLSRLNASHASADPFRLEPMIYAHRDPFRMPSMVTEYGRRMNFTEPVLPGLRLAADWLDASPEFPTPSTFLPATYESLIRDIEQHLLRASRDVHRAFEDLNDEEREFLMAERWNLSDVFAEDIYIHFDEDRARYRKNQRLIELAERVDMRMLVSAARTIAEMSQPTRLGNAKRILRAHFDGELEAEILLEKDTDYGKIIIGGEGSHWYREDAAFILDLGGDDFYSAGAGASAGWNLPAAICIDIAGNDAYETTRKSAQGAGCLGVGGLLDLSGNDQYIGGQWSQGVGYFGIGWLSDQEGDDIYRGRTFCQGVGLFGAGILIDGRGDDRYEGDAHVQAVGLAGGVGLLLEKGGDDEYYAKGLYPTGYGDEGIFDAWSQGCATGFRTLASGGMALLYDRDGEDRMEAGNFSQGGGYYYGWGILIAGGMENDLYIGSRYNQGFAAHQALGTFIEEGGDDLYQTRQGVAQGLAWDECVTLFIDHGGDDRYEGGAFFSQGASAHNSFCFFIDGAGRDTYLYAPGPARAGGNDYHGGTSFSVLIDEDGNDNEYPLWDAPASGYASWPEHGFWLDLEGSLSQALEELPE